MKRQQIRQAARRKALEGQEERRRERAAKDRRLEVLAVDVLISVAERDQAIREAEQRAGAAVRSMQAEGLSATEVAQWCGDSVSAREVRRLSQGVAVDSGTAPDTTEPGVAHVPDDRQGARGQERGTK
ncbi:MAG: hypothetical protein WBG36_06855 [Ornithinimicrobium sp.]